MLDGVMDAKQARVLLIDTCGEGAGVALGLGTEIVGVVELAERRSSADIVGAVRALLEQAGWTFGELDAVGVVSGPGSFTGVRTGLAAAKGICEGAGLRLVAVSRLEVLAEGLDEGLVALFAGRGEVYVREVVSRREWLSSTEELRGRSTASVVVVAEDRVVEFLGSEAVGFGDSGLLNRNVADQVVKRQLGVRDCLPLVLRGLRDVVVDAALVDGNYVRAESDIYKKAGGVST